MKTGIIADIHGRYEALREALDRLSSVDAIVNLGDVADYSPHVNECYDLLKRPNVVNLIGNHEQEVLASPSADPDAPILLDSDGTPLSPDFGVSEENKAFVRTFRTHLSILKDGLRVHFSHGYVATRGERVAFDYLSESNLLRLGARTRAQVHFCGHLHISQVIEASADGQVTIGDIEGGVEISIAPGTIYGINVGMFSCNRSNPARPQWAVLDTLAKTISFIIT